MAVEMFISVIPNANKSSVVLFRRYTVKQPFKREDKNNAAYIYIWLMANALQPIELLSHTRKLLAGR